MNARLYDPVNARFLRWDIVVADGAGTQGYNRYSYALNNPLKYTDPSGNVLDPVTLGLIGGGISVLTNGIRNMQNGQKFFNGAGEAFIKGFVFSVMTAGVGEFAQSLSATKAFFFQAGMHGLLGGMQYMADGGSFKSGFASGAVSSVIAGGMGSLLPNGSKGTAALMILSGGLSGGVTMEIAGGNFWAGFKQGIMTSALNHVAHSAYEYSVDTKSGEIKKIGSYWISSCYQKSPKGFNHE